VNEPDGLAFELVGTVTVIRLIGDLDAGNADELAVRAVELCREARAVALDLSETTYLDSAGVRLIDTVGRSCGPRGIEIVAVVPPDSVVRRVVELTLPTLEIIDDVHQWGGGSTSGEVA
jgi:anti-anti-sigma factor